MFCSLYKEVSFTIILQQSFLLTKMLKRDTKMRCTVINACYLFIIYNLVSGSGAGAPNTDVTAPDNLYTTPVKTEMHNTPQLKIYQNQYSEILTDSEVI